MNTDRCGLKNICLKFAGFDLVLTRSWSPRLHSKRCPLDKLVNRLWVVFTLNWLLTEYHGLLNSHCNSSCCLTTSGWKPVFSSWRVGCTLQFSSLSLGCVVWQSFCFIKETKNWNRYFLIQNIAINLVWKDLKSHLTYTFSFSVKLPLLIPFTGFAGSTVFWRCNAFSPYLTSGFTPEIRLERYLANVLAPSCCWLKTKGKWHQEYVRAYLKEKCVSV